MAFIDSVNLSLNKMLKEYEKSEEKSLFIDAILNEVRQDTLR